MKRRVETLGVIVAGGAGARLLLGVPKRAVRVGDRTLLGRAIDTLGAVCDSVLVATPRDSRLPDADLAGAEWVEDAPCGTPATLGAAGAPGEGPLAGIVAALGARPFRRALVLGVDLPRVRSGFLRGLLAELDRSGAPIVAPAPGGVLQPMIAACSAAAAAPLARAFARGERSPSRAMEALGALGLDEAFLATLEGGLDNLVDIDTPGDLEDARLREARTRTIGASESGDR